MIKFIHSMTPDLGMEALSEKLLESLRSHKKVLWLVCGGSNIPITIEIMNTLRQVLSLDELKNLSVMQTDERYGPVGHPDSNWRQMLDLNFNTIGLKTFPILRDFPFRQTVLEFGRDIVTVFKESEIIIGQLGIGPDGHIAGVLPHSPAVSENAPACGYEGDPFTRITITLPTLERINVAYVFAFGSTKKMAVDNLKNTDLHFDDQPAQILKKMPEVYFYSDQI
jgi:6-phosphogluconolactonase/glucosamine-6-phosphate isomerase/deaminase